MDPTMFPELIFVLGSGASVLIREASNEFLKDKIKLVLRNLKKHTEHDRIKNAYQKAMEQAFAICLEILLTNIREFGYQDIELKQYHASIKAFVKDKIVAEELLKSVHDLERVDLPSPIVLNQRWIAMNGKELPPNLVWDKVATNFRHYAKQEIVLSDELRALNTAKEMQEIKELMARQFGVRVEIDLKKYYERMQLKFSPLNLANLMPIYPNVPARMLIRDCFLAQKVRSNPPPEVIPKDFNERREAYNNTFLGSDKEIIEKIFDDYHAQPPIPVLDVIASEDKRLLVLTGEPGSGKSTLLRYLLTSIISPPIDCRTGMPLSWISAFKNTFPLLIELGHFATQRRKGNCKNILDYVAYLGKTEHWFIDDLTANTLLKNGQSLVMFDGLDEIFNICEREQVLNEIAGFAQLYPQAKIIVTSRPIGYKEMVLRDAKFDHYGIQDFDHNQIIDFIHGWFLLTTQNQAKSNRQAKRLRDSLERSTSIRLLAGNPMILTIMMLLSHKEELPLERIKFYEKAVKLLCHQWDTNRNLELPEGYLNADDKMILLRRIAMQMQSDKTSLSSNLIYEEQLELEIKKFLINEDWYSDKAEARKAARIMIQQLRERNYILCLRAPYYYGFIHRTFLEFLISTEYVCCFNSQENQMTINDLIELFDMHCHEDIWLEVLRLICGQIDEAYVGRIINHLAMKIVSEKWDGETPPHELLLAVWCLSEVRKPTRLKQNVRQLLSKVNLCFLQKEGESINDYLDDFVAAAREVVRRWDVYDNQGYKDNFFKDQALKTYILENFESEKYYYWPHHVALLSSDQQLTEQLVYSKDSKIRKETIAALMYHWSDDKTRKTMEYIAKQDEDKLIRKKTLIAMAHKWPDDKTRNIIEDIAKQDENKFLRITALIVMAHKWPGDKTRNIVEDIAKQDENKISQGCGIDEIIIDYSHKNLIDRLLLPDER